MPERAGVRPRILVVGGGGQIGHELTRELAPFGEIHAPGRADLDLGSERSIRDVVRASRPSVVVNAAAYTAVDAAEHDVSACEAVNAIAPGILAEEARRAGAAFIHYSTDYVFPGDAASPYRETDVTGPLNVYGRTKLAGEQAVTSAGGGAIVLRTSWVYGTRGQNFLRTILRVSRERDELRVVNDQVGSPTWSRMIAIATAQLLAQSDAARKGAAALEPLAGVYHLTATGHTSWYEFARAILARDPLRDEQRARSVVPVSTAEYPTAATRPQWSVLDCGKLERTTGIRLPSWETQLALALG